MPDDALKLVPDKLRRVEARVAQLEDRLEVLDTRRSTWVPSRSYANLTGRQREVVLCVALLLLGQLCSMVLQRLDGVG